MDKIFIKPITLKIEKQIWEKFKTTIPRTTKLNDAVVELIEKSVKK